MSDHNSLSNEMNYLEIANERKLEGNEHFRSGLWNESLVAYRSALNCLPKRRAKAEQPIHDQATPELYCSDESDAKPLHESPNPVAEPSSTAVTQAEKESSKLRSILHANIGACYVKLGDHKSAVESCTEALLDDPSYVKALERRASSNEILNTWSSLTSAQQDYELLVEVVTNPSQIATFKEKLRRLKPRLETAQKQETAEMMTKLKGLGNSILGNFGLSTDNFKFEPNGQGGYSVNFSR